jgi:hypothetical protein
MAESTAAALSNKIMQKGLDFLYAKRSKGPISRLIRLRGGWLLPVARRPGTSRCAPHRHRSPPAQEADGRDWALHPLQRHQMPKPARRSTARTRAAAMKSAAISSCWLRTRSLTTSRSKARARLKLTALCRELRSMNNTSTRPTTLYRTAGSEMRGNRTATGCATWAPLALYVSGGIGKRC